MPATQAHSPLPPLLHKNPIVVSGIHRLLTDREVRKEMMWLEPSSRHHRGETGYLAFSLLCTLDGAEERLGLTDWKKYAQSTIRAIESGRSLIGKPIDASARKAVASFWLTVENAQLFLLTYDARAGPVAAYPGKISRQHALHALNSAILLQSLSSVRRDRALANAINDIITSDPEGNNHDVYIRQQGYRKSKHQRELANQKYITFTDAYWRFCSEVKRVKAYCERRILYETNDPRL